MRTENFRHDKMKILKTVLAIKRKKMKASPGKKNGDFIRNKTGKCRDLSK